MAYFTDEDEVDEHVGGLAHRFWLGRLDVTVALARGQILARGPVAPVLRLVPHIEPAYDRYREQLEAAGREDLVVV